MSQISINIFEKLKADLILNFSAFIERKNWTQEEAAIKINCSRSHLSKILSGKRNPSNIILQKMEEVMRNGK